MTFRKEQEHKRDPIKVKEFSVMGVKDLNTLEKIVLHISINKEMDCVFLGLTMITLKVNLMKLQNM